MRVTLPEKILSREVGTVYLASSNNKGTHWVCYKKIKDTSKAGPNEDKLYYFDSFGLDPPLELQEYLKQEDRRKIELSTFQIEEFNTHHYGYFCVLFLKLLESHDFKIGGTIKSNNPDKLNKKNAAFLLLEQMFSSIFKLFISLIQST